MRDGLDIEAFHSRFFNVIARVVPGLEDLHYGLASGPPASPFGMMRRLKDGSRRLLERLWREAALEDLPRDARGLDVGCGLGGTLRFLAARQELRLHGLNLNREQLRLAARLTERDRGSGRIALTAGDAQSLPFAASSLRFAVLIEVAFHVRRKEEMFAELARVLEPGGRVLLVDQELAEAADVMGLFFFVAFGGYRELADRAGLKLVKEVDLSREVTWWMTDYARAASWPFHFGALILALVRGGLSLARQYASGVLAFNRMVREELVRRGRPLRPSPFFNGVRALRNFTIEEFEKGRSAYKLFVFEKPVG